MHKQREEPGIIAAVMGTNRRHQDELPSSLIEIQMGTNRIFIDLCAHGLVNTHTCPCSVS